MFARKSLLVLCSLAGVSVCFTGVSAQQNKGDCAYIKSTARKFTTCNPDPNTDVRCRPVGEEWKADAKYEMGIVNDDGPLYWKISDNKKRIGWINKYALTARADCKDRSRVPKR
jgi:hypothetical protein